ncbi:hypothetical protein EBB07_28685 [Paenibacillaceae bacterium]|nr:hypothetical protein EBB07_28685 [Paenibacillaceae bacterium]
MSEFKYADPLKNGYKQFNLTKKQHNRLFKYRQRTWTDYYEYYCNDNHIIMHRFTSLIAKCVTTLLFPLTFFVYGIANHKEIIRDHKRVFNEKKYGSYYSDHISKRMNFMMKS